MKKNYLIIGYGVVGTAVHAAMGHLYVEIHDPDKGYDDPLRDDYDGVILCLPTPQGLTGECDDMLVEQYHQKIRSIMPRVPILIKSTVSLELIELLQDDYYLTYNPEFLTEENAFNEFMNQKFAIFGGAECRFWYEVFKNAGVKMDKVKFTSMKNAAFAKYTINSFLATKVIFFNELKQVFGEDGFDELTELVGMDDRIGNSHMMVPGPDKKMGFGGMCFPKDTSAFVKSGGGKLKLLEKACEINKELR